MRTGMKANEYRQSCYSQGFFNPGQDLEVEHELERCLGPDLQLESVQELERELEPELGLE